MRQQREPDLIDSRSYELERRTSAEKSLVTRQEGSCVCLPGFGYSRQLDEVQCYIQLYL